LEEPLFQFFIFERISITLCSNSFGVISPIKTFYQTNLNKKTQPFSAKATFLTFGEADFVVSLMVVPFIFRYFATSQTKFLHHEQDIGIDFWHVGGGVLGMQSESSAGGGGHFQDGWG
jgi:hypothetical protein